MFIFFAINIEELFYLCIRQVNYEHFSQKTDTFKF